MTDQSAEQPTERPLSPRQRFPYIVAYGQYMGSMSYYIQDELERAVASNAPQDAVSRRYSPAGWDGHTWTVLGDLRGAVRDEIKARAEAATPGGLASS